MYIVIFLVNNLFVSQNLKELIMNEKGYSKWSDKEVKQLFSFVEECKQKNLPLTYAFSEYARLTTRKPNSVRNYYYLELEELSKNAKRKENLKIDLTQHQKHEFEEFNEEQTYKLAYDILKQTREGKSVRSVCLSLANNDVSLMIRYQNKFRSLLKTNKDLINNICEKLDTTYGKKENYKKNNVLVFPSIENKTQKNKITEEELKGLFMGLVKLVKKSADLEMSNALKKECNFANENLKKALVAMRKKEEEVLSLTEENSSLLQKVKQLEEQIIKLRVSSFKELKKDSKSKS